LKNIERQHLSKVAALPCKACINHGLGDETPAEVHHERKAGRKRAPYSRTMPLCPTHHRTGGLGVAFHATGRKAWESKYGTQESMIEQTNIEVCYEAHN